MAGRQLVGVDRRAREALAAVKRLRTELDYSLGLLPGAPEPTGSKAYSDAYSAVAPIAEILGVLRNTLDTIERELPPEHADRVLSGHVREHLAASLEWYVQYHRVDR